MNYPKISIVTPILNRADFLEETIRSVIEQGYPNLEYIVIDGGSIDGTLNIISKYADKLAYWVSEPDSGMYHAIQKGFEKSTGEIMAWINSDDKYHAGALYTVAQIFSEIKDIEWILGMPSIYNKDGFCVKVNNDRRWSKSRIYTGDYRWIQQESVFWKRTLWEKSGSYVDTNFKYAADFELWNRFFNYAQLYNVETVLSGFRSHGEQLSIRNMKLYVAEVAKIRNTRKSEQAGVIRITFIRLLMCFRDPPIEDTYQVFKIFCTRITTSCGLLSFFPGLYLL